MATTFNFSVDLSTAAGLKALDAVRATDTSCQAPRLFAAW